MRPMTVLGLPRDDEPFDFRRQAATYGRYRRDYSAGLYDAIEARTGPAGARTAIDVGCGTGFVTASLCQRGWRAIGVDLSAPMLAAASRGLALVRGRGEALPIRTSSASLVTAGTSFHWMPPGPTVAEMARVLRPGGWAAIFYRLGKPEGPAGRVIQGALARLGLAVPEGMPGALASPGVFAGSELQASEPLRLETTLDFTAEDFHGHVATIEWLRRLTGPRHARFLDEVRDALAREHPDGVADPSLEHLILARRR
jgi:SAM-dependent methyltransferase